jgi:hypothetical protein
MPYEIKKDGNKFCVQNQDSGDTKGCHESYKDAVAQLRLLYMIDEGKRPTRTKKRRGSRRE